jgi:hypothetical protein
MTNAQEKRLAEILQRAKALDNAEYILTRNAADIVSFARYYGQELAQFLFDLLDERVIRRATMQAAQDYAKSLANAIKSGALRKRMMNRQALIDSLLQMWRAQAESIATSNAQRMSAKAIQFQALSVAAEIPAERLKEIESLNITAARIGGKLYKYKDLSSLWDRMNKSYGTTDTIQFRNGANYPLRTYVDARQLTTEAEAHRMATIIEASADGVWFGTTNRTGTTDSCLFHEGEIFFLSEEARAQAYARYGQLPELRAMRTWQEIVDDKTHMGKFGCKHIVRPMMLQFMSDKKAIEKIKSSPQPEIPKKIDERKIFEQATGRKWQEPERTEKERYTPIAPIGEQPKRYTIA